MKLISYLGHKLVWNWCVIAFHEGNHMQALLCAALNTVVTNRTMPSREVEPAKTIQALATHPQKQKLCPFNNYIPLLGYGYMTLSCLTFPTDTHISDNCTKEQSCRSTMSLLRTLKAPTLRSTAKKHWYWALGKSPLGVMFIFCGYVLLCNALLRNVWIMWFASFYEMKGCSVCWLYPWYVWIDPAPEQSPWTLYWGIICRSNLG